MTVQELLASANISKEVIDGLPKEVASAFESHLTAADQKFTQAQTLEQQAAEKLRIAELQDKEIKEYVANYGTQLTEFASAKAEKEAYQKYLDSLRAQGFEVPNFAAGAPAGTPVVQGSPAVGGNAAVDEKQILNKVGLAMSTFLNLNNEHIRLYGQPLPDDVNALVDEASRARRPLSDYISEKYKFADAKAKRQQEEFQKKVDAEVTAKLEAERRKLAEQNGGNPNLRPGQPSRNSFVPKIKGEEFHKSDGNLPQRERMRRVLDGIHKDIAATNGTA